MKIETIPGSAANASAAVGYRHILVPLDGSDFAAGALDTAVVLAQRFDAQLDAVEVSTGPDGVVEPWASARLVASGARLTVVDGHDPATEIGRYAAGLESCLVCLSTHGRGRVVGSVIGSVARTLLQESALPIVAIGPDARAPSFVSPWPAPLAVARIVACVDGTAASEAVLPIAAGWARALGMSLTILIVAEPAPPALRPSPPKVGDLSAEEAAPYVAHLADTWQQEAPGVIGAVALDPISTAEGVKAYIDAHPAGLVAATTHSRTGLDRLRFGATVASIVHASAVPVLVVPLQD